jgi:streptogramin lyase
MRSTALFAASSIFTLIAVGALGGGCSDDAASASSSSSSSGSGLPEGGADTGAAPCVDKGVLTVTVTGLPASVNANITVTGSKTTDPIVRTEDLIVPAGEYKIAASDVVTVDPLVRAIYRATASATSVTVCPSPGKVTVTYAAVGTSGKVWTENANGTAPVLGFASSSLGATATLPATVAAKTRGGRGMAFDKEGNLWTIGGTVADTTLGRYAASTLATSGMPAPDRKINLKGTGCLPNAAYLAFDPMGNLWVSNPCEDKVSRVTAMELQTVDGEITPSVTIAVTDPKGLAFDGTGNLWVSAKTVHRFDASRLGASSTAIANAILQLQEESEYVAFDKAGDLWSVGGSEVNLVHIAKGYLAGTGATTPPTATSISVGVGALPQAIAFDESGGLWISAGAKKIARLAPTQLGTSTTYAAPTVPERVFTSDDIGSAGDIAIFPAPAALPLYHRAP